MVSATAREETASSASVLLPVLPAFCSNELKAPFITNPFYSRGTVSVGCGPNPTIEVILFGCQYPNPHYSRDLGNVEN